MTVSLTYDDTDARVLIDVNDFDTDVTQVMLERSTDQMHWTTVRGAVAVDLSGGAVTGYADYEFIPCVENFYRASAIPMGLYLPNVTGGSYASTPDAAALDITGDIFIAIAIAPNDWTTGAQQSLVSKYDTTTNNRSYRTYIDTDGDFRIAWSNDGTTVLGHDGVQIPGAADGEIAVIGVGLDVDDGGGNRIIRYYTAPDISGPWTLLSEFTVAGATSIFSGSANLEIGTFNDGAANPLNGGLVQAALIRNGATPSAGSIVMQVDFTVQDHHDTSFVDDTGFTWTINGDASIETTQTASITPTLTQVWLKSVTRPFLNRPVGGSCTAMGELDTELLVSNDGVTRPTRSAAFPIINRTLPVGVTDLALGRLWTLRTRTWTLEAHRLMDYLYASGDIIFIQVPCGDCAQTIENGYVIAFDPTYQRHRRHRNRVVWEATVQEVAIPGPDIAYREATWATVLAQYGTWEDVVAANPTWAHVLALLPDPSEVIVP